ncbi:hypothetical protein [Blastococcus sp. SYSU D00695]
MTAPTLHRPREAARFVLYDAGRQHTPPIPVPVEIDEDLPAGWRRDPSNPRRVQLPDQGRCPHGSFPRYAARNCCARGGEVAEAGVAAAPRPSRATCRAVGDAADDRRRSPRSRTPSGAGPRSVPAERRAG